MVRPKEDEEVAMLTLPDKKLCPEAINLVIEVVARVVVPLAVKSKLATKSPPTVMPPINVVVPTLPLIAMLSFESLPRTTSPLRVVVVFTVKLPDKTELPEIDNKVAVVVANVEVPETHKPPDKIEFPETRSLVMLVVA